MTARPDTTPDLAGRLVQAACEGIYLNNCPGGAQAEKAFTDHARAAVVAVLRELVERPRHGGPHMYCRSEGELRGLISEIEETERRA